MLDLNKNILVFLCCQLIMAGCAMNLDPSSSVAAQAQSQQGWKPATYMGLKMGSSTREDMLLVFGEPPDWADYEKWDKETGSDVSETIPYLYDNVGEFIGSHIVGVHRKRRIIMWINVLPKNLSKEAAIQHFGPHYIITKYDTDDCVDDEDGVPIFESPTGKWELFEYRDRGITFHVDKSGQVDGITFSSDPPGSTTSKCKSQR